MARQFEQFRTRATGRLFSRILFRDAGFISNESIFVEEYSLSFGIVLRYLRFRILWSSRAAVTQIVYLISLFCSFVLSSQLRFFQSILFTQFNLFLYIDFASHMCSYLNIFVAIRNSIVCSLESDLLSVTFSFSFL